MSALSLNIEVDHAQITRAFRRAPAQLQKNMARAISRIIQDIARSARLKAPKANSTLATSIQARRINALHGEVRALVNYAIHVEQGSAPGGKLPPLPDLLQWIRVKQITPNDPAMTERDLAFVIARSIARRGTQPQPFFAPALAARRASARGRIAAAIDKTLKAL